MGSTGIPYLNACPDRKGEGWNIVVGCTSVSAGCDNCWARELHNQRHRGDWPEGTRPKQYDKPFHEVQCMENRLGEPYHWRKPRLVGVSMVGDLFHEDAPEDLVYRVTLIVTQTPQHVYWLFTKRAERMNGVLSRYHSSNGVVPFPLSNLMPIVSIEDQETAFERLPWLVDTPAVARGVSIEPMLGPVDLEPWIGKLDWVTVGGESGKRARPFELPWAWDVRDLCAEYGVPFYMKQMGQNCPGWTFKNKHGANPDEWPTGLRIRQMPRMLTERK